jgi:hypothetical protein
MDTVGRVDFGHNIDHLAEAIKELSKQIKSLSENVAGSLQQISPEESEGLRRYEDEGTSLEFTLVTGGLIRGKILWVGNQSLGIRTDSDQNIILYKHTIAFIQGRAE